MASNTTPRCPANLGRGGRKFWRDITEEHPHLDVVQLRLLEEACRIWDRLDRLHGVLAGNTKVLLSLELPEDGTEIVLNVSNALAEARLQANAVKQIVVAMRLPDSAGQRAQRRGARGAYQTGGRPVAPVSALDRMREKSSG